MDAHILRNTSSGSIVDNDPKMVVYLKSSTYAPDDIKPQLETIYLWAVKIENTVHKQLGDQTNDDTGLERACERSSYRAKLIEYLARTTPWLIAGAMHNNSTTLQLDGTYGHDSNLYKCVVRDYLRDRWPQIPSFKLNSLDSYIAETALTHGQDTNKPLRFAVVLPALESIPSLGSNSSLVPLIRIISFLFQNQASGKKVDVVQTTYDCGVDLKQFNDQQMDPVELAGGKALVDRNSLEFVI